MASGIKKNSPTQTVSLIAVLMLVLGLGVIYKWFAPRLNTAKQNLAIANAQLTAVNEDINALKQARAGLTKAKSDLDKAGVQVDLAKQVVPATEDLPGLYIQMEDLMSKAQTLGVVGPTYQVSLPVTDTASGQGAKVPLTMTGRAPYSVIKQWLTLGEHNTRPILFSSVSITPVPATTTGTVVPAGEFNLTASGYVRAQAMSSAYATQ